MSRIKRIAIIGNSLPRRCGIATFTSDLQQAISASPQSVETAIIAMTDPGRSYAYPGAVAFEIRQDCREDYARAADFINRGEFDAVSLQHEFGIFGGVAGSHVLSLLERLEVPFVATLHTVLADPSAAQRGVLERIVRAASRVVVMAEKGRELLRSIYGARPDQIDVIPHGIPDAPFVEPDAAKQSLGFMGRTVILTFGLLSPNKGIEVMIDAMPLVLRSRPDAVYVVLGATHPNLVRDHGEAYRESLHARAAALGIEDHVVFLDQFVDRPTLLQYIDMCDIYVTPYRDQAQMTSGTLAYSFGLGKAVVSTPYWHARELLDDGRGLLVPFGDAVATGAAIAGLLDDEPRLQAMRQRAYADSRHMTWERTAERYITLFQRAQGLRAEPGHARTPSRPTLPPMAIAHLEAMSDDTGIYQHAIHCVPDRAHGYCVDDNARALLLACVLDADGRERLPERMSSAYAAFVQHAFNPDTGRFRNFMSFERQWLEPQGSEDSHGRTLWALGVAAQSAAAPSRRSWAAALFADALPAVEAFSSPRAWAFTLLGLDAYCAAMPGDHEAAELRLVLADRLISLLHKVETPDWIWLENGLSYDNARLCEALIKTGRSTGTLGYGEAGLRMLGWLMARQTGLAGQFRPIGSAGFLDTRQPPRPFDQQPVEVAATIAATLAAYRMTGNPRWSNDATRAFAWYFGANDLATPLVDPETGSCRDGLHPDRANENRGAESVLSYLLSLADMRRFDRIALLPDRSVTRSDTPFIPLSKPQSRGRIVASNISEPAGPIPPA